MTTPFVFKHEKFEGPLELLLDLIEKEKLSISEISLARVTDDYIRYVKSLEKIDPEALAEFLVVAAHLMLIKSRSLIPTLGVSEEEEASIDELEARLRAYQRLRERAKGLKQCEAKRRRMFSREAYQGINPIFYPPPKLSLADIRDAYALFIASLPKLEKLAEEKIKKILTLEEKITQVRLFLQEAVERAFSEVIRGSKEKVEIIVSFLAILELARQKFISLEQEKPFKDIMIRKTP